VGLAGLARWWNDSNVEPAPGGDPARAVPGTEAQQPPFGSVGFRPNGSYESFHGLLEQALLTEALADGIEVLP
jgi:hypothetical protein